MTETNGPEQVKGRSADQIKADFKRFLKRWHPERGAEEPKTERVEDMAILNLLTLLLTDFRKTSAKNFSGWPDEIRMGARVVFPKLSEHVPGRAFFLPKTPDEFFDLLDFIDRRNDFPPKEFPLVGLGHRPPSDEDEDEDDEEDERGDPTLQKFANFVSTRESISDLLYSLDLITMYDEAQLHSIGFKQRYDERAYFLFVRDAWKARTLEEIQLLLDEIETKQEFKFYTEEVRVQTLAAIRTRTKEIEQGILAEIPPEFKSGMPVDMEQQQRGFNQAMDRGARRHFVEKLRDASTKEDLEALEAQVAKFPFFNRGELGIVRSVLSRKRKRLGQESGS